MAHQGSLRDVRPPTSSPSPWASTSASTWAGHRSSRSFWPGEPEKRALNLQSICTAQRTRQFPVFQSSKKQTTQRHRC